MKAYTSLMTSVLDLNLSKIVLKMVYNTRDFWNFEFCPYSGILKSTTFRILDLFPPSGEGVGRQLLVGSYTGKYLKINLVIPSTRFCQKHFSSYILYKKKTLRFLSGVMGLCESCVVGETVSDTLNHDLWCYRLCGRDVQSKTWTC
jgi:hypothetical protein